MKYLSLSLLIIILASCTACKKSSKKENSQANTRNLTSIAVETNIIEQTQPEINEDTEQDDDELDIVIEEEFVK